VSESPQLPSGWTTATIGDIADQCVEQAKPSGSGIFLYVDISSIDRSIKRIVDAKLLPVESAPSRARQRLLPGDVLVSMTRPNLNAVAMLPSEMKGAIGSTGFFVLRSGHVVPSWLFYLVQTADFINSMSGVVLGVLYPAVRPKDIASYRIDLPPVQEQRRIVAEIDQQFTRLDAAVSALKRVRANLKRYRVAVLKAACEGRLVPTEAELARKEGRSYETGEQLLSRILKERRIKWEAEQLAKMHASEKPFKNNDWKKKYRQPEMPEMTGLPTLPEGWVWTSPDQLAEFQDNAICAGPFGTIFKAKDFRLQGVPIIFLRHVGAGHYDHAYKPGFMDSQKWEELFRPYSVFGGELLVTKLGEPPGTCAIYPQGLGPAMVTPDVIKMSVDKAAVSSAFLMHYLNSERAKGFSAESCFGTTRLRLTIPLFRRMPVPLPPIAEQDRVVEEVDRQLSDADALRGAIEAQLIRADRLRQSILKRAFEGKLVRQDPSDEPALALLERIRAERAAHNGDSSGRRSRKTSKSPVAVETK
jgi:type I restriction enzyme S subunit